MLDPERLAMQAALGYLLALDRLVSKDDLDRLFPGVTATLDRTLREQVTAWRYEADNFAFGSLRMYAGNTAVLLEYADEQHGPHYRVHRVHGAEVYKVPETNRFEHFSPSEITTLGVALIISRGLLTERLEELEARWPSIAENHRLFAQRQREGDTVTQQLSEELWNELKRHLD